MEQSCPLAHCCLEVKGKMSVAVAFPGQSCSHIPTAGSHGLWSLKPMTKVADLLPDLKRFEVFLSFSGLLS